MVETKATRRPAAAAKPKHLHSYDGLLKHFAAETEDFSDAGREALRGVAAELGQRLGDALAACNEVAVNKPAPEKKQIKPLAIAALAAVCRSDFAQEVIDAADEHATKYREALSKPAKQPGDAAAGEPAPIVDSGSDEE